MVKKILVLLVLLLCAAVISSLLITDILTAYARLFRVDNPTPGAQGIFILSGSPANRVPKGLELFRDGMSNRIYIFTVKDIRTDYPDLIRGQTWVTREILSRSGIEAQSVPSVTGGVTSTFDEAHDLAAFLKVTPWIRHVILVTDASHTARARYAFQKVLKRKGLDIRIDMAAAANPLYSESDWWRSEAGMTCYFLEPLKFLVYFFRQANLSFIEAS